MTDTTTAETSETTETQPLQKLTAEQEINALRSVHKFLSEFDRVPGALATTWGQALDTIAVVANSLIAKNTTDAATVDASAADSAATAN
jgi:hypothetical protein